MRQPMRVLCIMDLSLAGRAALGVVMPVLAACGAQAVPLPAALFSTHTGGFGSPVRQNQADFCARALQHFEQQNITFDAVYTGYLYGEDQFAVAEAAFEQYPGALHVVDPAMADGGKLYSGLTEQTVTAMRRLFEKAGVVTPNYTESALLLGLEPKTEAPTEAKLEERLAALSAGGRSVVITSVPVAGGGYHTVGCGAGGKGRYTIPLDYLPAHYPGTGDAFTAAMLGLHLAGHSLEEAARGATQFTHAAVQATYEGGGEARSGLWFEPLLGMLNTQKGPC